MRCVAVQVTVSEETRASSSEWHKAKKNVDLPGPNLRYRGYLDEIHAETSQNLQRNYSARLLNMLLSIVVETYHTSFSRNNDASLLCEPI